jgi:hypothetical protein
MLLALMFLMQAALPPPGLQYYARTDFDGPGLVCGAAFSFHLLKGETAVLKKSSFVDAEVIFNTRDGRFTVHESQYATSGGELIRIIGGGVLRRKHDDDKYIWIYTDNTPGSTDVFGPSVNAQAPSSALRRIRFGSVQSRAVGPDKCLDGRGSDSKLS